MGTAAWTMIFLWACGYPFKVNAAETTVIISSPRSSIQFILLIASPPYHLDLSLKPTVLGTLFDSQYSWHQNTQPVFYVLYILVLCNIMSILCLSTQLHSWSNYFTFHLPFCLSFGDSQCNCVLVPRKSSCKIICLVCGFASYTASHFLNGKLSLFVFWLFHSLPLLPNTDVQHCC